MYLGTHLVLPKNYTFFDTQCIMASFEHSTPLNQSTRTDQPPPLKRGKKDTEPVISLIAVGGVNNDPITYAANTRARARAAQVTFPWLPSFSTFDSNPIISLPLSDEFDPYTDTENVLRSPEWDGSHSTDDVIFVIGNIGKDTHMYIKTACTIAFRKFGQGPGFNFNAKEMQDMGITNTVTANDAVSIPISDWRVFFQNYGHPVDNFAKSGLAAMFTSLFGDNFFNQNMLPAATAHPEYGRTTWSFQQATDFMKVMCQTIVATGNDLENILGQHLVVAEQFSEFSKDTVESFYKPLKELRQKHHESGSEIYFLRVVNELLLEGLEQRDCSAKEYDAVTVHAALICFYLESRNPGTQVNYVDVFDGTIDNTTVLGLAQRNHIEVLKWSLGIDYDPIVDPHIKMLKKGVSYIKKNRKIKFFHDLGLDAFSDDYLAINLMVKAMD